MRLTREFLQKAARDLVAERVKRERDLLAVYLCGSVLGEEPLLGDSGDIDLVFVHYDEQTKPREIVRLNDQIHLDILHHSQALYSQPRQLRQHPWLGPTVFSCKVLYDPQHLMDFTVAGVRGQFDLPENVYERARVQVQRARQAWMDFSLHPEQSGAQTVYKYMQALEKAVNAVVCLNGNPLTERRFLLDFPYYAQAAGAPGLAVGILGLLGAMNLDKRPLTSWLPVWEAAYRAANTFADVPAQVHIHRLGYYRMAIAALIESPQPANALWALLHTWTVIACYLPEDNLHQEGWQNVCGFLALLGEDFERRILALDSYLDTIEEVVEYWGRQRGISE